MSMMARCGLRGLPLVAVAAAAWAAGSAVVSSEESVDYCIRCTMPDLVYVCRVHAADSGASGQQFFCIMSIAQQFQHASCAVSNQPEACTGQLVQLEAPASGAVPAGQAQRDATVPAAPPLAPSAENKQPKTLVEFSKQTVDATANGFKSVGKEAGSALQNTGEKIDSFAVNVGRGIKDATKKTVNCVTSLFTNCSD